MARVGSPSCEADPAGVRKVVLFGTRTPDQEVVETAPALSLNVQEA
jgi:hypothetical protein